MSTNGPVLSPPQDVASPMDPRGHRTLRVVAVLATAITILLVGVGGLVRATGSGEGCTGWPKCSAGRWLPPLQYHAIIEYSHRMTAFLDIVLVGLLAVVATRRYRMIPRVFRTAWIAVGLVFVQAILGGIVVKGDLAALLVTAHFGTAMILLAVVVYATVASFSVEVRGFGRPGGFASIARVATVGTFALLVVGAYVRGEDAGLVFADWPLMSGRLIPDIGSAPAALQFTHRVLAVVVGVMIVAVAGKAWRERGRSRPAVSLAFLALGLFLAQVMIGAVLVWTKRAEPAIVAHVTVAGLVWSSVVATAAASRVCGAVAGRTDATARAVPTAAASMGSPALESAQ